MITGSRTARRVLLLVPIFLALAACSGGEDDGSDAVPVTPGKTGPGDAGDHFPMQVGNVWQFAGRTVGTGAPLQPYVNVVTTVGTRDVSGTVARVFRDSNPSGSGAPEDSPGHV